MIDDGASMQPHWEEVKRVMISLAHVLAHWDPDGMDLYFAQSESNEPHHSKKPDDLIRTLYGRRLSGKTNITTKLGHILSKYKDSLQHQHGGFRARLTKKQPKPLNVYIITDGIWQPESDPSESIRSTVQVLKDLRYDAQMCGLQFIRVGNNEDAIEKLDNLDSRLFPKEEDIVDHEPSTGNFLKMVVGAVNKWFDDDDRPPRDDLPVRSNTGVSTHTLVQGVYRE